jgi:tripartite-type tricarboxylate transporter receptor subunit TctC
MIAQTTFAIFVPAGTPKDIVDRVSSLTQAAMADKQFQARLVQIGFEPLTGMTPDSSERLFRDEAARWVPIIKAVGATND